MTKPLRIRPSPAKEKRGDLRAEVAGGNLLLPKRVVDVLAALDIRTAVDLVSYLQAFPSSIAIQLGWDLADVSHALQRLRAQLKERPEGAILNPPFHPEPPYGALKPPELADGGSNGATAPRAPRAISPIRARRGSGTRRARPSRRAAREPDKGE
jgi:hypothetical protein